jgi:hypothetical protein
MLCFLGWNLQATVSIGPPPDGVQRGDGPHWMDSTEKLSYARWNLHHGHPHSPVAIALPPDVAYRRGGPP